MYGYGYLSVVVLVFCIFYCIYLSLWNSDKGFLINTSIHLLQKLFWNTKLLLLFLLWIPEENIFSSFNLSWTLLISSHPGRKISMAPSFKTKGTYFSPLFPSSVLFPISRKIHNHFFYFDQQWVLGDLIAECSRWRTLTKQFKTGEETEECSCTKECCSSDNTETIDKYSLSDRECHFLLMHWPIRPQEMLL